MGKDWAELSPPKNVEGAGTEIITGGIRLGEGYDR